MKHMRKWFLGFLTGLLLVSQFFGGLTVQAVEGETQVTADKSLKVLAIGNSFSEDALRYLYQVAEAAGYEEIVLGNLYIGGCELNTHWNNAQKNSAAYLYQKNTTGTWTSRSKTTMEYGIRDEAWDVITLQQASGKSGLADTYNTVLDNLANYINSKKTNSAARLGWHMTWAYQGNSTHSSFPTYGRDQQIMYQGITEAVQNKILTNPAFDFVIPAGTAIQNVRSSYIGDTLTRDGYHLSENTGRYIAALTWFKALTGREIKDISYVPDADVIPGNRLPVIREAVEQAIAAPYVVTPASETVDPAFTALYSELSWDFSGKAYWNSGSGGYAADPQLISTMSNSKYFVASTRRFTKEELPIGSIIELDAGYQYRADGWAASGTKNPGRPGTVTINRVVVDENWWGRYEYRAFNVSVVGSTTDLSGKEAETAAHLRIYVPNSAAYQRLDWSPTGKAYWNSGDGGFAAAPKLITTMSNSKYFIASGRRFTQADIPVGSIIEIDAGYQYRGDAWAANGTAAAGRPNNVITPRVVVDETWWADREYRAFNLSVIGSTTTLTNKVAVTAPHLRIYVPKN